jgi:ribonucleotide monophosphatase NagD (HAD superfamily)
VSFRAAFVFHDPRDWALDTQVLLDVLRARGVVGAPYQPHPMGAEGVELVFCNPDLLWRSEFERPRLGQGAFKTAFQAIYKVRRHPCAQITCLTRQVQELTGYEYPYVQYGKPTKAAYQFAERVLRDRLAEIAQAPIEQTPNVYMVGGKRQNLRQRASR